MNRLIVADSSPLIALLNIGHFELLERLFSHIVIPVTVAEEVERGERVDPIWFELKTAGFIQTEPIQPDPRLAVLRLQLDPGESEAILLAAQLDLPLLIDERAGRKLASLMGLTITGLVGVLLALRQMGEISSDQMPEIVIALERVKFRISADLKRALLDAHP